MKYTAIYVETFLLTGNSITKTKRIQKADNETILEMLQREGLTDNIAYLFVGHPLLEGEEEALAVLQEDPPTNWLQEKAEQEDNCTISVGGLAVRVNRTFDLSFCVQGHVRQTVEILSDEWDQAAIVNGLNSGKLATTIQDDGTVDVVESGEPIARILNSDNECEYTEFGTDFVIVP